MVKKVCFKCKKQKELNEYYKHKQMLDGHLNKCKECVKTSVKKRYQVLSENEDWMKKERERSKEKYHRLNYKEQQKKWDKNKPWKNNGKYKNLSRKLNIPKGLEIHHWNYKDDYIEDVFIMDKKNHRRLHVFLEIDIDKRIFKVKKTNKYLDTKKKHYEFAISNNIEILDYSIINQTKRL